MGHLGCPLCCQQDFISVVALHDHLLYYIYRPLRCAVCNDHVGGIQELTHHLERHINDTMPTSLSRHTKRALLSPSRTNNNEQSRKTELPNDAQSCSSSASTNNDSLPILKKHSVNEEPIELVLRAYFCQTCGAKVVGKDAYFAHIRSHIRIEGAVDQIAQCTPDTDFSHMPSPAGFSDVMSPNLASNSTNVTVDGNATTDTETVIDSAEPSDCLSDYMDEDETGNQLLKLREWQLEKLGKNYRKHKVSLSKTKCVSGSPSPVTGSNLVTGKLSRNNSPIILEVVDSSARESRPSSEASSASFTCNMVKGSRSDKSNTVEKSNAHHHKQPETSGSGIRKNTSEFSLNSQHSDLDNREMESSATCHLPVCKSALPLNSNGKEGNAGVYSKKDVIDHSVTSESNISDAFMRMNREPRTTVPPALPSADSCQNMLLLESQKYNQKSITSDNEICSLTNIPTPSPLVTQLYSEQVISVTEGMEKHPSYQDETYRCENYNPQNTSHSNNLSSILDSVIATQCRNSDSSAINPTFWESSDQTPQYTELQHCTPSISSEHHQASALIMKTPDFKEHLPPQMYNKEAPEVEVPLTGYENQSKSDYCCSSVHDHTSQLCEEHVNNESVSCTVDRADLEMYKSSMYTPDLINETQNLNTLLQYEVNNPVASSEVAPDQTLITYEGASDKRIDPQTPDPSIIDTQVPSTYVHKKFHHDQERKLTSSSSGQPDLNRFINNFQSLLVSKLNRTLGTDMPLQSNTTLNPGTSSQEEIKPIKQPFPQQPVLKEYMCEVCGSKFQSRLVYKSHCKTHEVKGEKNFFCKYCNQTFFRKYSKDLHERKHTGKNVHKCDQCSKIFTKWSTYQRHLKEVHAIKKPFVCAECSKEFSTQRRLQEHIGVHQSGKKHKCSQCQHACRTASGLRTHVLEVHSESKKLKHACSVCGEKFAKKYGLKRHTQRKHLEQQLSCDVCSKDFSCSEDLMQHVKSHANIETLKCNLCAKTFSTSWALQRHSVLHTAPTKWFKCPKCLSKFTRKDSLQSHYRSHTKNKPFVCYCGKAFCRKSQLKEHQDAHSKTPKYTCSLCSHSFKFKVSLRNHSCKEKINAETAGESEEQRDLTI